jgi:DNA-binding beta-propeller fold protein YncE
LNQSISLPNTIKGAFDHFGLDLKHQRLFATPEDSKAILVIDLNTGKLTHQISGIARPHAVLYREDLNRIYVTDGGDGLLRVYDGATYQPLASVHLLKDADSIGYEPSRQYLYVVNGGGDVGQKYSMLSVLDTRSDRKVADIKIDGDTLEAMSLDLFRPRLYVNNTATSQIVVVDRLKNAIVAKWPVTLGKTNVAMALDEQRQRLFVGCRSGQIVVFDTNTGKELQALPITKGVDDLIYDVASRRLYAAGDGAVASFQQIDADHYDGLESVPTGAQGKTARLVPELNRLFVAVPQSASESARILALSQVGVPAYTLPSTEAVAPVDAPLAEEIILSWRVTSSLDGSGSILGDPKVG